MHINSELDELLGLSEDPYTGIDWSNPGVEYDAATGSWYFSGEFYIFNLPHIHIQTHSRIQAIE